MRQNIPHLGLFTEKCGKLLEFSVPRKRDFDLNVQYFVKVALPLGQNDPADPMVFEVPVEGKHTVWHLWCVLICESQWRPSSLLSNSLPLPVYI